MSRARYNLQNNYHGNGSQMSERNSRASRRHTPADDRDTPYSETRSIRTPSGDRQLLRTLTVSPETYAIQGENTPSPTKSEITAIRAPTEPPVVQSALSERQDYEGTPKSHISHGAVPRMPEAETVRISMPTETVSEDDWQAGKTVPESNSYMLRYEVACDVTFIVGDDKEEIRAHKYMLLSRSPVFYKTLLKHLGNIDVRINVPDIKPNTFREMLTYLYTDEFDIHSENVTSVLYAAKKFSLKGLSDLCFRFLDSEISFENVCKIMEQAHIHGENGLYEKCLAYIFMNGDGVLQEPGFGELCADCAQKVFKSDDLRAKEQNVFEAAITWAKTACRQNKKQPNDGTIREVLGNLLYLIRFPIMDVTYFTQKVSLRGILSNGETLSIFQYIHGEPQQLPNRFNKNERIRNPRNLAENKEPSMLAGKKSPNISCVTRFRTTDGEWRQRGPPDAISFTCSHPVMLYGVKIFGTAHGSNTYDVEIVVYDDLKQEVRRNESGIYTNSTRRTYDVYLARPIRIPPQRTFTVLLKIKGASTVKGIEGSVMHVVDGVTFEFSNSNRSSNGTDVTVGQIAGLLFNKTQ